MKTASGLPALLGNEWITTGRQFLGDIGSPKSGRDDGHNSTTSTNCGSTRAPPLAARAAWREGYSNENTQVTREPTPPPQEEGGNATQSREDRRSTGQATNDEQNAAEGTVVARRRQISPRKFCTCDSTPSEENKQEDDQPLLRRRYAESSEDKWEVSQDTSFPTLSLRRRNSRAATIEPEEAQSIPEAEPGTRCVCVTIPTPPQLFPIPTEGRRKYDTFVLVIIVIPFDFY